MRTMIVLAAALSLAACASGGGAGSGEGGSITISKGVWAKFQEYKNKLTPSSDEYFAASEDGGYASDTDKDKVVSECQKYAKSKCILFAHNDQILVDYHVR